MWMSDRWQPLLRAELLPETIVNVKDYAAWIPGYNLDERYINLAHLVLWAYQKHARPNW